MKFISVLFLLVYSVTLKAADKIIHISSPDKNIAVTVTAGNTITYQVSYKGSAITSQNRISMRLGNGEILGVHSKMIRSTQELVNKKVYPVYGMANEYSDNYSRLELVFDKKFSIVFRVYNNGVAYRFLTSMAGRIKVEDEEVSYSFTDDVKASMMKVNNFVNSYEEHYIDSPISWLDSGKLGALPLLVESRSVKIGITEADLLDYAGMYLTYDSVNTLSGIFPKFVLTDTIGGCCPNFDRIPVKRANYVAETEGTRSFPWRLMIIAEKDKDLLYNNLVYLLASENKIGDTSWIKPGKVAWDWWCANNLNGVSFKTGFNTETYKYFIDFAAAHGIEYINLDEGWSDQFDLLKVNNGTIKIGTNAGGGFDMPYLMEYAKKKNVGIILWCVWHTLDRQMNAALDQFQQWGIKGLKVDFMDRDDQSVVNFYERLAKEAAKRKMLLNFHGAFKPTGLERAYPNIVNREAVQGLEYNKFSNACTPDHAAHIPFIRMLAGPMDYTPGGMYNANEKDFRVVSERPMTQGTRCQQLAFYTLLYAPLEMLSDAPTTYEKEPEILNFIASMPTTWDETVPLDGKVGEFAVIARRKGSNWYVGGMTDWTARNISLVFDFLSDGKYQAEIFTDGVNANRLGNDFIRTVKTVSKNDSMSIAMANGGGFALRIIPIK